LELTAMSPTSAVEPAAVKRLNLFGVILRPF
jgi:hypothetical protein